MVQIENEMYIKKVQSLKEKIKDESLMIDEHQSTIDELENEISEYENEYDYESDPNGNDYDLNHVQLLKDEIEEIERLISRCEWEIQCYEEELNQIEFWLGECTIELLLQKWEIKLNGYFSKKNDCENDYRNGEYQTEADFQSDYSKWIGMIDVINQLIEDLNHLIKKSE